MNKKQIDLLELILILVVIALVVSVGIAYAMDLPLPIINDKSFNRNWAEQTQLMNEWNNVRVYSAPSRDATAQQIVQQASKSDTNNKSKNADSTDFYKKFTEVDKSTLDSYLANNKDALANGYSKLLIDKVDVNSTPTGIKTKQGDDVLVIDSYDNMLIIGTTVDGQKAKVAVLKNKKQLGFSVVQDLAYWSKIQDHAASESAVFAVNASGYTWNTVGNYGVLYGMAKKDGTMIRKCQSADQVIGFTQSNDMKLGNSANIDDLYNACEYSPMLIKDGSAVYGGGNTTKMARTAIGQASNGDIIFVTVDGGIGDDGNGATISDMLSVMQKFGAVNAASLSEGNRSIMWWSGRIINNCYDYNDNGIRLPDAWVVKSADSVKSK